jgi:hypothetical protein
MIFRHQWNKTVHTGNILGLPNCVLTTRYSKTSKLSNSHKTTK